MLRAKEIIKTMYRALPASMLELLSKAASNLDPILRIVKAVIYHVLKRRRV